MYKRGSVERAETVLRWARELREALNCIQSDMRMLVTLRTNSLEQAEENLSDISLKINNSFSLGKLNQFERKL